MRISTIVIAMIIFAGLSLGLSNVYVDITASYDVYNRTNESTFYGLNRTKELNERMEIIQNKTVNIAEKVSTLDLTAIFDVGSLILDIPAVLFEIPNILDAMIKSLSDIPNIEIPSWFGSMITALITAVFVFAILSLFLKREV